MCGKHVPTQRERTIILYYIPSNFRPASRWEVVVPTWWSTGKEENGVWRFLSCCSCALRLPLCSNLRIYPESGVEDSYGPCRCTTVEICRVELSILWATPSGCPGALSNPVTPRTLCGSSSRLQCVPVWHPTGVF